MCLHVCECARACACSCVAGVRVCASVQMRTCASACCCAKFRGNILGQPGTKFRTMSSPQPTTPRYRVLFCNKIDKTTLYAFGMIPNRELHRGKRKKIPVPKRPPARQHIQKRQAWLCKHTNSCEIRRNQEGEPPRSPRHPRSPALPMLLHPRHTLTGTKNELCFQ